MSKAINITYKGKTYKAGYNKAAAKNYASMGFRPEDVLSNPFLAAEPFVYCALKAYQPTISKDKSDEIFSEIPKNTKTAFLTALIESYSEALEGLIGNSNAEGGEGNATWEAEDSDN